MAAERTAAGCPAAAMRDRAALCCAPSSRRALRYRLLALPAGCAVRCAALRNTTEHVLIRWTLEIIPYIAAGGF